MLYMTGGREWAAALGSAAVGVAIGALVYRAVSGRRGEARAVRSVVVARSAPELYAFWRDFENLPRFMDGLRSVDRLDGCHSRWVAEAPAGGSVGWEAGILEERENELVRWRSLPGSDVENAGSVWLRPAPGGHGTEVRVEIVYRAPAAGLLVRGLDRRLTEDLRRFKRLMETGEIATTEGQPHGRRSPLGRVLSSSS